MEQLIQKENRPQQDRETHDYSPESAEETFSRDRTFELLSNQRRRFVLFYLQNHDSTATMRELAAKIAAWENDIEETHVTYKQRKRVYTSLYQSHLQKMGEYGVIEYERNSGNVKLTPEGESLDAYLEIVSGNNIPWSDFFLGLALLSSAFMLAVVLNAPLFVSVPEAVAGFLICGVFAVSALVHMARTRQSRLLT